MEINILPYIGINENIKFGMSQIEIEHILGIAPNIEIDNIMKEVREQRLGMVFIYKENKLVTIRISKHVKTFLNGIDLFNDIDAIEKLKILDQNTEVAKNNRYINFYSLGLSMGGFLDKKIPEGKLIIAFCKERELYYKLFLNA